MKKWTVTFRYDEASTDEEFATAFGQNELEAYQYISQNFGSDVVIVDCQLVGE